MLNFLNLRFWKKPELRYSSMQLKFYEKGTSDHLEHNKNPDYWNVLLAGVSNSKFDGALALDFGCGKGRNVFNLRSLANWESVDGSDLSRANVKYCKKRFREGSNFFLTKGTNCGSPKDNYYDFVMSTITLQHIPVHTIRTLILKDILKSLKPGGRFSFQMGYGEDLSDSYGRPRSGYFENSYFANGTNGDHDVRVTSVESLKSDLAQIGFESVEVEVRNSFSDAGHPQWVFIHAFKKKP